jgi:hypothetical protein
MASLMAEDSTDKIASLESLLRNSLNDESFSDEALDALLELSDVKRVTSGKLKDETIKLLEVNHFFNIFHCIELRFHSYWCFFITPYFI